MSRYQPPLTLTARMLALIAGISEQIGQLSAVDARRQAPQLRRSKLLRALRGSAPLKVSDLLAVLGLTHKATFRANTSSRHWRPV